MPARPQGVYPDGRGGWYLKATVGHDPLTGKRTQITKRGYRTVAEAGRARRELQARADSGQVRPSSRVLTVDELLDLYLDDLDADGRLSAKTRFDYRTYTASYVRPLLGSRKVRDLTPVVLISWQRKLLAGGGAKNGKPLAPNTGRLARAPGPGAAGRRAQAGGVDGLDRSEPDGVHALASQGPVDPRHWTPEQAREFLALMEAIATIPCGRSCWARGCGGPTSTSKASGSGWWSSCPRSATTWWPPRARAARRCGPWSWTPAWCGSCGPSAISRRPTPRTARPPTSLQRHAHAGERGPTEGGGRAPRPRRCPAVRPLRAW